MYAVDYAGMVVNDEQDGLMAIRSGIQISGAHKALMLLPSQPCCELGVYLVKGKVTS